MKKMNQRPKRVCEETHETFVEAPSTATLVEDTLNINPNLLTI